MNVLPGSNSLAVAENRLAAYATPDTSVRIASDAMSVRSFIFFFQAEDGIRHRTVTGVQTCALPICLTLTLSGRGERKRASGPLQRLVGQTAGRRGAERGNRTLCISPGKHDSQQQPHLSLGLELDRSEERRVGKECGRRRGVCEHWCE